MKLLHQTHSPFSRKVLVFAHEAGVADELIVEHHETSPTNANDLVFSANPLGKVPVLLRKNARPIFDSDVICAYLDTLHDGRLLIPTEGEARWTALQYQALAQGMAEAGIQLRWETVRRPEPLRYRPLAEGYAKKIQEGLAWIEVNLKPGEIHVGHIALATALDWLMFRDLVSLAKYPVLDGWLAEFRARSSMKAAPMHGDAAY